MKQVSRFTLPKGWRIVIEGLGINPKHVLTMAELPVDLFALETAQLSVEQYFRFWSALEAVAGDRDLSLELGQHISVEAFDPPIFASMCNANSNVALQRPK